jgi:4-amino-4-deoxy-L-arabinose transferase-like glycosyltransferase
LSHAERVAILLLGLLLFLPGIGGRDLWNPDEPRYAEVAREMRAGGDWLVPHLNGRIYAEKPPLLFWMIGAASFATGEVDEVAARLPSLLSAIVALYALFGIARRFFDRRVAWAAVLVFATSGRILWQARVGQIDMLLLACVTLAMYGFVRGWVDGRRSGYRLFFVAAGLGTLAKGPVGLLPPLLSILLFAWLARERGRLREMGLGTGLAIWAGIVLLWLVPAAIAGGEDYLRTILFKQNVQRFADPWHHLKPFWYYLTTIPADFFPWTFFLPGALWVGWRRSTEGERRGYLFALSWIVATVLFFSISPAKRTVYVLQMFPALALLVGYLFVEVGRSGGRLRRWIAVPAALLAALLALGPLALPRVAERQDDLVALGSGFLVWVAVTAAVLALAALGAWALAAADRPGGALTTLAAGTGAATIFAIFVLVPRFEPLKSFRPLAERYVELAAPDDPYAIWYRVEAPILFYTKRVAEIVHDDAELAAFLHRAAASGRRAWLFIDRSDWERLERPPDLEEIGASAPRGKSYLLFASPEPSLAPSETPAVAPAPPDTSSSGRAQVF